MEKTGPGEKIQWHVSQTRGVSGSACCRDSHTHSGRHATPLLYACPAGKARGTSASVGKAESQLTSAVLHVYICLYNRADIDDICVCLYLFISDLACLYNGMFISGYRPLYLDMDLYICSYNRHI